MVSDPRSWSDGLRIVFAVFESRPPGDVEPLSKKGPASVWTGAWHRICNFGHRKSAFEPQ
jgi:hypothetical protein